MMLFSMLSEAQGGKSIAFLSRHFGLSNRQMTNVIRHFLPILMRGIQKNFAKQGGLTSLLKTLDHDNYASYFEDPNIYSNPHVRNSGNIILEKALGSEEVQKQIMHRIYLSTGIDPDTLFLVLPYVTTLALSALYIKAHTSLNPAASATQLEYHGQPQAQPRPVPQAPQYQPVNHQQQQYAQPIQQQQAIQQPVQQTMQQPIQQPRTMQPGVIPHPAAQAPRQQAPQQQMHQQQIQQQQPHQQQAMHHTNAMPQGYPQAQPQQEKLPNIIRQAQAAHEQKERRPAKKGRLSQMLKAPFQGSQSDNTSAQQRQPQQYATPPQPQASHYQQQPQYQQVAHTPAQVPARPQVPSRKYISLQEKLTSQLPWYEQTG